MPDLSSDRGQVLQAPEGADEDQWGEDLQTCSGTSGGAGESGFKEPGAVPGAEEKMKELAKCMRQEGFSDFPDGENALLTYKPDDQSAFDEVSERCSEQAFGKPGEVVEQ